MKKERKKVKGLGKAKLDFLPNYNNVNDSCDGGTLEERKTQQPGASCINLAFIVLALDRLD